MSALDARLITAERIATHQGLGDHFDVESGDPQDGEVPQWVAASSQWQYATVAGGSHGLTDHTDVTLASVASGDLLHYNGANWENTTVLTEFIKIKKASGFTGLGIEGEGTAPGFEMKAWGASPYQYMQSANGTEASPTASTTGRWMGFVDFAGYDGSAFAIGARLIARPTATWADATPGPAEYGTEFSFATTSGTSTTLIRRVSIANEAETLTIYRQQDSSDPGGSLFRIRNAADSADIATIGWDGDAFFDSLSLTTDLAPTHGGTGLSDPTAKSVLVTEGVSAMSLVTAGTAGRYLRDNGTTWVAATIPSGDLPSHTHAASDVSSGTFATEVTTAGYQITRGTTGSGIGLDLLYNATEATPDTNGVIFRIRWTDQTMFSVADDGIFLAAANAQFSGSGAGLTGIPILTGTTGTLTVARGGTGATGFTARAVVLAGTTAGGALRNVSGLGTANQVLTSNGAGADPTWQDPGAPANVVVTDPSSQQTIEHANSTHYLELAAPDATTGPTNQNSAGLRWTASYWDGLGAQDVFWDARVYVAASGDPAETEWRLTTSSPSSQDLIVVRDAADTAGRITFGTGSATTSLVPSPTVTVRGGLYVVQEADTFGYIRLLGENDASGNWTGIDVREHGLGTPYVVLQHSRGTKGTPAVSQSGDALGGWYVDGYSTAFNSAAYSEVYATATWGASEKGARWDFYVSPDGEHSAPERILQLFHDQAHFEADTAIVVKVTNTNDSAANWGGIEIENFGAGVPYLQLSDARGTQSSATATQSGDFLGAVYARGRLNASTWGGYASMQVYAAETFTVSTAATRLVLTTSPTSSPTTDKWRMSIEPDGEVRLYRSNGSTARAFLAENGLSAWYSSDSVQGGHVSYSFATNSIVQFRRAQGTRASSTAITGGLSLGAVEFAGAYNTTPDYTVGARIRGQSSNPWSSTTVHPTVLYFSTSPESGAIADTMILDAEGDLRPLRTSGTQDLGSASEEWDTLFATKARLSATGDASLSSTLHAFQIGPSSGANIIMDQNEIMARNNGAADTLHVNANGGAVEFGVTTAGRVLIHGQGYSPVHDIGVQSGNFGVNWDNGTSQYVTLSNSTTSTVTMSNEQPGSVLTLIIRRSSNSGSLTFTDVDFGDSSPTIPTVVGDAIVVTFYVHSATEIVGFVSGTGFTLADI